MSISWRETRVRLKQDRQRLLAYLEQEGTGRPLLLLLHNAYLAVWLHRLSHYLFERGLRLPARFFWHLNLLLTGADISPLSDLGGGLLLPRPLCVILVGKVGANCTIHGHGGLGGGRDTRDIGAGPGLPVVGDDVVFHVRALVLGPVRIGRGVCVGPGCLVTRDLEDGQAVELKAPRKMTQRDLASAEGP